MAVVGFPQAVRADGLDQGVGHRPMPQDSCRSCWERVLVWLGSRCSPLAHPSACRTGARAARGECRARQARLPSALGWDGAGFSPAGQELLWPTCLLLELGVTACIMSHTVFGLSAKNAT